MLEYRGSRVNEVVQAREEAAGSELADPGEEREVHVRVAVLDDTVEPAQEITVGPRQVGRVERVQNRLVVVVDQHHHAPPGALVQRSDQAAQTLRRSGRPGRNPGVALHRLQLVGHVSPQIARPRNVPLPKLRRNTGWRTDQSQSP